MNPSLWFASNLLQTSFKHNLFACAIFLYRPYLRLYQFSFFVDEFKQVVQSCTTFKKFPFDFDNDFVNAYFGEKKDQPLSYTDFTHFMRVSLS